VKSLQKVPVSIHDLQASYNELYQGWMGKHKNIGQAQRILGLLDVQPGKRLIDIACGLGYLADMASDRGLDTVGIDVSRVALEKAQQEYTHVGMFLLGDAERLPWPDHAFDYAVNLGSLEHFIDPAAAVREMSRVLKPDGRAALLLPNSHHIRAIYNVYKHGEILPDLQDFERFATRVEWERLLTQNGLCVLSVHKYDTGMARAYKRGHEVFWYLYNIFFRLFGSWIPLNLTYTFIFICTPGSQACP
jgi:ubiquinone/menaquinone biosynthesis C-methylase UbiE